MSHESQKQGDDSDYTAMRIEERVHLLFFLVSDDGI
jgi:hypothetical protein